MITHTDIAKLPPKIHKIYHFIKRRQIPIPMRWQRRKILNQLGAFQQPYKIHVACGNIRFGGWVNLDISKSHAADVIWDATKRLPLDGSTCSFIYSEHFLEHLTID